MASRCEKAMHAQQIWCNVMGRPHLKCILVTKLPCLSFFILDMVGFVRAVQDSSRPSTADSTSTSDATSRPTTANDGDQETEDKDKDEDEAMSLD